MLLNKILRIYKLSNYRKSFKVGLNIYKVMKIEIAYKLYTFNYKLSEFIKQYAIIL